MPRSEVELESEVPSSSRTQPSLVSMFLDSSHIHISIAATWHQSTPRPRILAGRRPDARQPLALILTVEAPPTRQTHWLELAALVISTPRTKSDRPPTLSTQLNIPTHVHARAAGARLGHVQHDRVLESRPWEPRTRRSFVPSASLEVSRP